MDRWKTPTERWRAAEREASDAESALLQANLLFMQGRGPEPTALQRDVALTARAHAQELMDEAMRHMGRRGGL